MTAISAFGLVISIVSVIIFWSCFYLADSAGLSIGLWLADCSLMAVGGLLAAVFGSPSSDMPYGSPTIAIPGLILAVCGIVWFVIIIAIGTKRSKELRIQSEEDKKISFYLECVESGITECKSEKEIQKAILIAQKHGMKYSDISTLFYEAKASKEQDIVNKKNAEVNTKKEEEEKLFRKLNAYSDMQGRDKRIAILSDQRTEALKSAESTSSAAYAVMSASQQKELDWAIRGGIASGIAGGTAGLAVAADTQIKNAQIRAQNEENKKAFVPLMMASYKSASDDRSRAASILNEIEETKTKLVSNDSASTCFSKLQFLETTVKVSETGTCTIVTKAKLLEPLVIFDDVNAVIDGTIIGKIYNESTFVGEALLVLPTYGISNSATLTGMCLFCGEQGKKYSVSFSAKNLWAMEK